MRKLIMTTVIGLVLATPAFAFGDRNTNTLVGVQNQSSVNRNHNTNIGVNVNKNRNVNRNYNTNVNVNSARSDASANSRSYAKGGDAKSYAKGGKASASSNQQAKTGDISVEGDTVNYEAAANGTPLAGIDPTAGCQVPVTASAGVLAATAGFGTSYTNENCVHQEQTRFVCQVATHPMYSDFAADCVGMIGELKYVKDYRAKLAAKRQSVASADRSYGSAGQQVSALSDQNEDAID